MPIWIYILLVLGVVLVGLGKAATNVKNEVVSIVKQSPSLAPKQSENLRPLNSAVKNIEKNDAGERAKVAAQRLLDKFD